MRYVSLDIETTGLEKETCQVLQIAAVIDDLVTPVESLPHFSLFVEHENLIFEPYALKMHMKSGLLNRWFEDARKLSFDASMRKMTNFIRNNYPLGPKEKYNFAGKNLQGFDIPFLAGLSRLDDDTFLNDISHRVIDPSCGFTDFYSDSGVVNLDKAKARAGIMNGAVTHDALADALDVVRVVRQLAINNRGRFLS